MYTQNLIHKQKRSNQRRGKGIHIKTFSTYPSKEFNICVFFKKRINTYVYESFDTNVCVCKKRINSYVYKTATNITLLRTEK